MDKLIIQGTPTLEGDVFVSGSKNAALPIMAATLLAPGKHVISNIPTELRDVRLMKDIITFLGARIIQEGSTLIIDTKDIKNHCAPYELVSQMRASICVLGPLMGRFNKARVSMPGGCVIGPRPIDLHLKGLRQMQCSTAIENGYIVAESKGGLKGTEIFLGGRFGSTVLGTCNLMMAAVKAQGTTMIECAACEPEIIDLANFLNSMGADIKGAGSPTLIIEGVKDLHETEYEIIPDRIEAGTFLIAAAMTSSDITIKKARADHLHALIHILREAGLSIDYNKQEIRVNKGNTPCVIDVTTMPYPGFPTDLQAQMMALMSITEGISVITEKVFPERFMHISELNRMGACISLEGNSAIVHGVKHLSGAEVMASDLRASAALVLAGLTCKNKTEIHRVYHIDRGYENLEKKLNSLGADIRRQKE